MEKYAVVDNKKALKDELSEIQSKLGNAGLLKIANDEVADLVKREADIVAKLQEK